MGYSKYDEDNRLAVDERLWTQNQSSIPKKSCCCPVCGQDTGNQTRLENHIKTTHPGDVCFRVNRRTTSEDCLTTLKLGDKIEVILLSKDIRSIQLRINGKTHMDIQLQPLLGLN